jgi:hypothetical protein
MNPNDFPNTTVYADLLTVLKERGYTDDQAAEILAELISQAEFEVMKELWDKLTPEQRQIIDESPDDMDSLELGEKLDLDPTEIDELRAQKTAQLISALPEQLDTDDDQVTEENA